MGIDERHRGGRSSPERPDTTDKLRGADPGRGHLDNLSALALMCWGPSSAQTGAPGLRKTTGQVGSQGHDWTGRSNGIWNGTLA